MIGSLRHHVRGPERGRLRRYRVVRVTYEIGPKTPLGGHRTKMRYDTVSRHFTYAGAERRAHSENERARNTD